MSNLHETYKALIEAGMPEHPRLRYVAPAEHSTTRWEPYWVLYNNGTSEWDRLGTPHEDDAHAILTIHALEWANERGYFSLSARQCMNLGLPNPRALLAAIVTATDAIKGAK